MLKFLAGHVSTCRALIAILILLMFPLASLFSQTLHQNIKGIVKDKDSKADLPGANILLLDTISFRGTVTNTYGEFKLDNVPIGRHSLKISYMGYKDFYLKDIQVNSAREVVLNVELEENIIQTEEIVIKAEKAHNQPINEMSTVSTRTISISETNKYASSWGDPARMASRFAGVTGNNDAKNDIIVRGNSPLGVLWRMEGIEIQNPNHFASSGATGGAVSMINGNLLEDSDFLSGAFAAEYGNATSAVFDLRLRKGNNEKREYIGQMGANGFELGAEGPFSKKSRASYLVNYRYSSLGLIGKLGALDWIGAVPNYQDLSFKLFFPLKKGNISFFGLGGNSRIGIGAVKDTLLWESNKNKQFDDFTGSKLGMVGVSWQHFTSQNSYIKATVSPSYSTNFYDGDSLDKTFKHFPLHRQNLAESRITGTVMFNKKFNANHTIRTGIVYTRFYYDYAMDFYYYTPAQNKYNFFKYQGNTGLAQAYFQWKYKINEKWTLNSGMHNLFLDMNNAYSPEPRVSLRYDLHPRHSLTLGYGIHGRMLPPGIYYAQVYVNNEMSRPNTILSYVKASHYVLSWDFGIAQNLRLLTECYYQNLTDVPVRAGKANNKSFLNYGAEYENIFIDDKYIYGGKGRNYGVEATLEKFFARNYYFLATGSLYESKYTGTDNIERNTVYNGNYVWNLMAGKDIKTGKLKRHVLSFNVGLVQIGGRRQTPIDLKKSIKAGNTVRINSLTNTEKTPDYFRVDVKIGWRMNFSKFSQEFGLDVRNVTNHKNIWKYKYNPRNQQIETTYQMGLFPILFYRIEF